MDYATQPLVITSCDFHPNHSPTKNTRNLRGKKTHPRRRASPAKDGFAAFLSLSRRVLLGANASLARNTCNSSGGRAQRVRLRLSADLEASSSPCSQGNNACITLTNPTLGEWYDVVRFGHAFVSVRAHTPFKSFNYV